MTIGPNSSGRSDARLVGAQPAWQLPITQGLLGRRAGRRRRRIASATASGGITRASTVDRSIERAAFDDEFRVLVQHVRSGLRAVFSVLSTALAHHVEKQDRTLPGIERIGEASANDEIVG